MFVCLKKISAAALVSLTMLTPAFANTLDMRMATVTIWQNSGGYYRACGPSQCTSSSYDTAEQAFELVKGHNYGVFQFVTSRGRCSVYQSNVMSKSYDNSASRVLSLASC